jgi:protein gp37
MTKHGPRWTGEVRCIPEMLSRPLHWKKPRTVFVNSMSDLFHEKVPFEFIARIFRVMALCRHHQFVILTKRNPIPFFEWLDPCPGSMGGWLLKIAAMQPWPLRNVAIGVSCENQEQADKRIPWLTLRLAQTQFVSIEPLLSGIDLNRLLQAQSATARAFFDPTAWRKSIDGIIVGCESGPKARPMDEDWARSIRDQCQASGVNFFLKQLIRYGKLVSMPMLDGRVWDQLPWRHNA